MHGHRLPLQNLLEAMERVDAFIEGLDFRAFQRDEQVSRALAETWRRLAKGRATFPKKSGRSTLTSLGRFWTIFNGGGMVGPLWIMSEYGAW